MAASDATNAMQANAKAKAVLVTRYRDEFKIILGDEREKRGLPRDAGPDKTEQLKKRIEAQEAKLEAMKKELEGNG